MTEHSKEQRITVIGIDLAKQSFHLCGMDAQGRRMFSKQVSRARLAQELANRPPCLVAMEACGSAHYWARTFQSYGHEVKLIAPQFVKPFVKSNKNDAADAEAIAEAAQRPTMRFVPIKSVEQQDIQAIHRMRSQAVAQRTAHVNQVRGLLAEYGLTIPLGRAQARPRLAAILEDAENGLRAVMRTALHDLADELRHLDERVTQYDAQIAALARASEPAQRLMTIPGIGPLVATALIAAIGSDPRWLANGRGLAAFLGLVPRQHSTGGRDRLLGISKRGNIYLRQLLIHGARSVLHWVERKTDALSRWAKTLLARRHTNIAAVALANKIARIAYAVLTSGQAYDPARGALNKA
jgi:transposase